MPKFIDLKGQKINRLTALQYIKGYDKKTGQGQWECLCECGNITHVTTQNLFYGRVKSCGCYKKEGRKNHFNNNITLLGRRKTLIKESKKIGRMELDKKRLLTAKEKKEEKEAIEKLCKIFGGV